jgi:bacterioferritin
MDKKISRKQMVDLLNEDLAREYQAIIAYVIYSQTMKGAEFNHIAQELEKHAGEELAHAIQIAKQSDYLNGKPINRPKEVKVSDKPKEMLRFDLRERTPNPGQLSAAHPAGRRYGRIRSRRSVARDQRPRERTPAGPG